MFVAGVYIYEAFIEIIIVYLKEDFSDPVGEVFPSFKAVYARYSTVLYGLRVRTDFCANNSSGTSAPIF